MLLVLPRCFFDNLFALSILAFATFFLSLIKRSVVSIFLLEYAGFPQFSIS